MDYSGFNAEAARIDRDALRKQSVIAMTQNTTGEIKNPLLGIPKDQLLQDVEEFAQKHDMVEQVPLLRKGALVAQNPADFENMPELDDNDRLALREEITRRWHHPLALYETTVDSAVQLKVC